MPRKKQNTGSENPVKNAEESIPDTSGIPTQTALICVETESELADICYINHLQSSVNFKQSALSLISFVIS
ncbi:TPA: hypothetical protein ACHJUR_004800 [Escherichia coli]|nr:hypothetical protein [Escherichia coli]EFK0565852.1 hypothetical protein [Escherichia coli]EFK0581122.1 hypothetical protein [Escherichia coli]EFK8618320.1 hypothetical protein [Escherichia coli]